MLGEQRLLLRYMSDEGLRAHRLTMLASAPGYR